MSRSKLLRHREADEPSLVALAEEVRRRMAENPDFRHWYPTHRRLFEPFEDVPRRLRSGDDTAIDPALLFLEADPWCFRSGYLKESLMRALASGVSLSGYRRRIHRVLIARLRAPQPGLRKPSMALAAAVWGPDLDEHLTALSRRADDDLRDRVADLRAGVTRRLAEKPAMTSPDRSVR